MQGDGAVEFVNALFDAEGGGLASLAEVRSDPRLEQRGFRPGRQRGWLPHALHEDDTGAYAKWSFAEVLPGYAGPPPMVRLRRGETLRRYLAPGLEDEKTFVFWGRDMAAEGIPGPERDRTWVNQPDRMRGSTSVATGLPFTLSSRGIAMPPPGQGSARLAQRLRLVRSVAPGGDGMLARSLRRAQTCASAARGGRIYRHLSPLRHAPDPIPTHSSFTICVLRRCRRDSNHMRLRGYAGNCAARGAARDLRWCRRTGRERGNDGVGKMASLEQVIAQFRRMLPEESATARAIDQQEPWERIALNAVDDGYIEFANELGSFIEICLRRST